jgi:hypothetical protein
MRREKQTKIWVNDAELEAMDAGAKLNGMSRSEYSRARILGRPLKAQKALYKLQQALERKKLRDAAEGARLEREAEEDARLEAEAEVWNAAQKRRRQAEVLAQSAGWAEKWFATMSSQDRARWRDLEQELVNSERLEREATES